MKLQEVTQLTNILYEELCENWTDREIISKDKTTMMSVKNDILNFFFDEVFLQEKYEDMEYGDLIEVMTKVTHNLQKILTNTTELHY